MSEGKVDSMREQFSNVIRALWWLTLLRGILLLILGLYAIFRPELTLAAFVQVIGVFMIIEGVIAVWFGISGNTATRGWTLFRGVALIVIGLFVVFQPMLIAAIGAMVVVYLLAIAFIVGGIAEIYVAIRDRHQIRGEGWLILGGVLSVLLGLLLCAAPLFAAWAIVRVIGVFAIIAGIGLIIAAFSVRNFGKEVRGKASV